MTQPQTLQLPQRPPPSEQYTASECIRLIVKKPGGVVWLAPDDIESLESDSNYVLIRTTNAQRYRLRARLANVLRLLESHGFIRIHRCTVVRGSAIVAVEREGRRKTLIVLRVGAKFEVGRGYQRRLRMLWQPGVFDLQSDKVRFSHIHPLETSAQPPSQLGV